MMKSFFKKLAFVMALAMVVTTAAPAATKAVAANELKVAYQAGGVVTELNMKAGDKEDLKFLGATNWKNNFKWTSSNEAVATVDQTGLVTAVADGTATIIITVGETTGTVAVNVGTAKTYDVTLGTADDKAMTATELKVGESIDLNFYGVKDWNKNNYTVNWSANSDVVTVDTKGIVTAVTAGTAVVTATIVNTVTGVAHNVTPVTVTVPEEKKADAFTVAQADTTNFKMTFAAQTEVKAEDVTVIMMINDVEAPIPVKSVSVKDTVATVELFSTFIDGVTYKVTYGKETQEFVGSIGAIATVSFNYWTNEKGDNVAYVSTEEEPSVTTLVYELYDANGVNVTDAYNEDELSVEFTVVNESDDYEVIDNELIFYEAGAAVVEVKVVWTSEDGDEVEKVGNSVVVATKRPALAHNIVSAGFINVNSFTEGAQDSFVGNAKSPLWTNKNYQNSWILGDDGDFQFAALVKDNRGNTVATGINAYGTDYAEDEEGNLVYPYGYFKFVTSNDEVVDVDNEGVLSFWDKGTASIITYFVDTTGEEEKEVFVGATKITVNPKRYVATYAVASTSLTAASATAGADNTASFVLTAFDQYGRPIELKNGASDITVETTSNSEDIPVKTVDAVCSEGRFSWGSCTGWWCGNSQGGVHYHIDLCADDFVEYLDNKSAKTVQYNVTVDKEENSKITTAGTTKIKFTVKNTNAYAANLEKGTTDKFYYAVGQNKTGADLAVTYVKNFSRTWAEGTVKTGEVSMNYLNTTNGFTMAAVPADNIIALEEDQKTGEAGKLYFEVSVPKKASNWNVDVEEGKIVFSWNTANGTDSLKYATTGTYKVTVYYVKNTSSDKLSKLGTYSFNITNSQVAPKFAGFDAKLGNKTTTDISTSSALDIIKENLVFTLDGATIDWEADGYSIDIPESKLADYITVSDTKIRVNKVDIYVPIDDGNDDTTYTYKKTVTVGKTIYFTEEN